MGSAIPNKDAWTRARDRYVEDLSKEERALYEHASPESIFYDASAAQKIHVSSSTGVKTIERLKPLIAAIEQYSQALDVYANAYPLVLCPLWGSIRIVLQLARGFGEYFERIVEMFARIGDLLPRFRVYENLFPSHERLVHALSITYIDVLVFCTEAKTVFRRERRSRLVNPRIFFKLSWKPFKRHFGHHIENFRVHVKNVEKEASLSHMMEASDSRAMVLANHRQLEKVKKQDAHKRIIAAIPSVDYITKHKKLQSLRHEGTCTWVLRHNVYRNWYNAVRSSTLCCSGIPGCGKTILASFIVDALQSAAVSRKASIIYYYCDYADQRTLETDRILGTILKQFLSNGHIPEAVEKLIPQGYGEDAYTLSIIELIDLVCVAIKQTSLTFFIVDGLDECEKTSRKEISSLLDRLQKTDTPIAKILISFREEDQVLRSLQGLPTIHMTSSTLGDDIRLFVSASVRSRITSRELRIRNPSLENEITDELVNKAHGMFLWVFFQLDDLCEAPSDALIRKTLQNLPNGLSETYERVLNKICRDAIKRDIVQKIFKWIICARRPFGIEELREAAGFEPNQKSWDFDVLPDPDLMVEACKGLVIWDRDAGIVRFAHHTVRQFLLSDAVGMREGNLKCTQQEADIHVGKMCLTYLFFSDFDTQIQVRSSQSQAQRFLDTPQAGPANWIPQMLGVPTSMLELPFRFLGLGSSLSAPNIDYAKFLKPTTEAKVPTPSQELGNKYRLLQYIIDHWVFHTKWIEFPSSWTQKLRDLAMYKILPFEFRPWGPNEHYGSYGCVSCTPGDYSSSEAEHLPFMSLFHYAAEVGHWLLMEPLVTEYCAHEKDNNKGTPFCWDEKGGCWLLMEPLVNEDSPHEKGKDQTILIAIWNGHQSIVEHLAPEYEYDDSRMYPIMLNAAASSGHEMILRYLLNRIQPYKLYVSYIEKYAHFALAYAAVYGHQAIVEFLWQVGVSINKKVDRLGETPISAAAAHGHDHVIRFLIDKGAWQLRTGTTPLHRAARYGHPTVARTLLQSHGAGRYANNDTPPNVTDPPHLLGALDRLYETPLHLAAKHGHDEVVKVMLEYAQVAWQWGLATTPISAGEQTALHLAAANGHLAVVMLLCDHQSLNSMDSQGRTPLILAARGNHVPLLKWLLLQHTFNATSYDNTDCTALDYAVFGGHEEVVQILAEHDPSIINPETLFWAALNRHEIVLDTLVKAHREGGMHVHAGSTKKLLYRAQRQALSDEHHEASQILKKYWKQELE
ncbi:MAG: hypothetical protein Q9209_003793 [Squamulea sp. 1 TL-2023]